MESKKNRLLKSIGNLEAALQQYRREKTDLNFLTVSKAFETLIEYSWRELKRLVEDQGLESPAPKIAVKEAAKLHFISDPETWLQCIDARNNSVHDYFGITEKEYCALAEELLELIRKSKLLPPPPDSL